MPLRFTVDAPRRIRILEITSETEVEGGIRGFGVLGNIHLRSRQYRDVCTAPCEGYVLRNPTRLAITYPGRGVITFRTRRVRPDMTLQITYRDRHLRRGSGVMMMIVGAIGAGTLIALSYVDGHHRGRLAGGVLLGGLFVGAFFTLPWKDRVRIAPVPDPSPQEL